MRRLALVGVLLALPFAAVPLVWAAAGGDADRGTLAEFRTVPRVAHAPTRPPLAVTATPTRVTVSVVRAGGVDVAVRDARRRVVRQLGHFTLLAGQRVVLAWDGRGLRPGTYTAVARAGSRVAEAPLRVPARS